MSKLRLRPGDRVTQSPPLSRSEHGRALAPHPEIVETANRLSVGGFVVMDDGHGGVGLEHLAANTRLTPASIVTAVSPMFGRPNISFAEPYSPGF
ncbi:MAG: hypothetical protein AAFU79_11895 [Myxococcota bacterium]